MLDYGLPQKEKKTVVRGNVGAAATGLLQPTRLAVENPFNALQWKIHSLWLLWKTFVCICVGKKQFFWKGQVRHGEACGLNHSVNDGAVVVLLGGGGCGVEVGGKVMWGDNLKLVLPGGFSGGFWVG